VVSLEKDALLNVDPVTALKNTFVQTNAALLVTKINYVTSGATCVAVYVKGTKLYVANVGDSRAVMAYRPSATEVEALTHAAEQGEPEEPQEGDFPIAERYLARDMSRDHKVSLVLCNLLVFDYLCAAEVSAESTSLLQFFSDAHNRK